MPEKPADDAVSEIISFLLIFALVTAAVAAMVLFYLPSQGGHSESEHDNLVLDQISKLKTGIDLLWTTDSRGVNITRIISMAPTQSTDLAQRLFLAPSLGSAILHTGNGTTFTFNDKGGVQHTVSLLRITYASYNMYAPDYIITYDGGAVFLGQRNESTYLLLSPLSGNADTKSPASDIVVINATNNAIKTTLGNLPVVLEYTYTGRETYSGVSEITFAESDYKRYWNETVMKDVKNITVLEYTLTWKAV